MEQSAKAPGNPTQDDIEAASGMSDEDRMAMIRTMVETLDARLADDPKNFEGWMRIVRSYAVLDRKAEAGEALRQGLQAFPVETEEGRNLLALANELGIDAGKDVK